MDTLHTSARHCPNCRAEREDAATECGRCGIIFAKYKPLPLRAEARTDSLGYPASLAGQWWAALKELAFTVEESVNPVVLAGRGLVFLLLLIWGWKLASAPIASNYVGESFMHLINLPFHEAGHLFFIPLGRFMQVLGGSLGQLIVPMVCLVSFLFQQRNPFGAAVALWWTGESLLDLTPYIADARALDLMLLGGVTGKDVEDYHDWEYILRTLGWLQYDQAIAVVVGWMGTILMAGALVWAGWLLRRQYQRCA